MRMKKFSAITIATVFALSLVFCFFFSFSIKKVSVTYAVQTDCDTRLIEDALSVFNGQSLLFFDTDDVETLVAEYPYFEFCGAEKQFPNVLNVSLKERREVFCVFSGSVAYFCSEDGVILKKQDKTTVSDDDVSALVEVNLTNFTVDRDAVGKKIGTDDDGFLYSAFKEFVNVGLTDNVKKVELDRKVALETLAVKDVYIYTATGVKIEIWDFDDMASEKMNVAFRAYNEASDDGKCHDNIYIYQMKDGDDLSWVWSPEGQGVR